MDQVPGVVRWSIRGAVTAVALLLCGLPDAAWSVPFREGDEVSLQTCLEECGGSQTLTVRYGQPEFLCPDSNPFVCDQQPLLEQIDIEAKTVTFSFSFGEGFPRLPGILNGPLKFLIFNHWEDRNERIDSVTLSSSNIENLDDSDVDFDNSPFGSFVSIDFLFIVIGGGGGSATLTLSTVAPVPVAPLPVVLAGFLLVLAARHLLLRRQP